MNLEEIKYIEKSKFLYEVTEFLLRTPFVYLSSLIIELLSYLAISEKVEISINIYLLLSIPFGTIIIIFLYRNTFIFVKNHNKNRPGILFEIECDEVISLSTFRHRFHSIITEDLHDCNIKVCWCPRWRHRKIQKLTPEQKAKKYNVNLIFEVDQSAGNVNSKDIYKFTINDIYYPYPANNDAIKMQLAGDLNNSLNSTVKICEDNYGDDISISTYLIKITVMYDLLLIMFIMNKIDSFDKIYDRIDRLLKNKKINNKQVEYISASMYYRHLDRLSIKRNGNGDSWILSFDKNIREYNNYFDFILKAKMPYDEYYLYVYLLNKAIIGIEENDLINSLLNIESIKKCKLPHGYDYLLFEALIYAMRGEYSRSYNIFVKAKTKIVKDKRHLNFYQFLECQFNNNQNNQALLFCKCILIYVYNIGAQDDSLLLNLKKKNEYACNIILSRTHISMK